MAELSISQMADPALGGPLIGEMSVSIFTPSCGWAVPESIGLLNPAWIQSDRADRGSQLLGNLADE
ncbi:hypothetical protein AMD00_11215 [Viridibacillus arvi]|uniref:Uncharacterized protein n=1 Tax=Viridibacillus arvi TaxID=263475 RepID=A0A0M0LDJ2_9BACL|nr:hypothetical protein AMD00_11215 [Viridibacillus arvi]